MKKKLFLILVLLIIPLNAFASCDSFTTWLLHSDGTNASASFPDSSPSAHTQSAQGSAQVDTSQKEFGTGSGKYNGSTDWVQTANSSDFNFGTGDFTIDFWVRFNSVGECGWISNGVTGSGGFSFN